MTTFTLHEVWEMMQDLSMAQAQAPGYEEKAVAHAEKLQAMNEEQEAAFQAQASAITAAINATNQAAAAITDTMLEELDLPSHTALWSSSDLLRYLGLAQTKGEFAELLALAPLGEADVRVLFAFVEPPVEDEDEAVDGD